MAAAGALEAWEAARPSVVAARAETAGQQSGARAWVPAVPRRTRRRRPRREVAVVERLRRNLRAEGRWQRSLSVCSCGGGAAARWREIGVLAKEIETRAEGLAISSCRTVHGVAEALGGTKQCERRMAAYYFGHCEMEIHK